MVGEIKTAARGGRADPLNAFIDPDLVVEPTRSGPLSGLAFAAKDLFDVAGHVTGAGNPDWQRRHPPAAQTAPVVQRLLDAGARLTGKTHTDELSRGIFGENAHYGTPVNPRAPGRVPGGSSSGSAAAVAAGLVPFALGTDTGGSVRVPASFCGLYGLRPTHGRLALDGVVGQAPSFDTVGWLAADAAMLARVGAVLLDELTETARRPRRLVVAEDMVAAADPAVAEALRAPLARLAETVGERHAQSLSEAPLSAWLQHQAALQGREAWATFGPWIDRWNPRFGFEVADSFLRGARVEDAALNEAAAFRAERRDEIAAWLDGETIVAFPTTPFPAPAAGQPRSTMWALRARVISFTAIAGMLGAPQLSIPAGGVDGLPVGLSLMAAPGEDAMLLAFAAAAA